MKRLLVLGVLGAFLLVDVPDANAVAGGPPGFGGGPFSFPGGIWLPSNTQKKSTSYSSRSRKKKPSGNYVWVGDHWERVKAKKVTKPYVPLGTTTVEPIIRDHRTPKWDSSSSSGGVTVSGGGSGPIIRDHRTPPVVRDHRK